MIYILFIASSHTICRGAVRNYVQNISRLRLNDVNSSALQGTVPLVLDMGWLLLSPLMVVGETLLPHRASEMSSARRREMPARYNLNECLLHAVFPAAILFDDRCLEGYTFESRHRYCQQVQLLTVPFYSLNCQVKCNTIP